MPGINDTTFTVPDSSGRVLEMRSSPDGRQVLAIANSVTGDSLWIYKFLVKNGNRTRLASFASTDWREGAAWLADGSVIISVAEVGGAVTWYRISATGGKPVRLGSPPYAVDANYFRMSADGRLVVVRVQSHAMDVYLVRNLTEMLPP